MYSTRKKYLKKKCYPLILELWEILSSIRSLHYNPFQNQGRVTGVSRTKGRMDNLVSNIRVWNVWTEDFCPKQIFFWIIKPTGGPVFLSFFLFILRVLIPHLKKCPRLLLMKKMAYKICRQKYIIAWLKPWLRTKAFHSLKNQAP